MVSLKVFQEELKELLFFREQTPTQSRLWKDAIPDRLSVYRNNTRSNWTDTLDHDFPLTRKQFSPKEWEHLRERYFIQHPPQHWELNASMTPFAKFLKAQPVKAYVKELADYEWVDLKVFIDRAVVKPGLGVTNPTAIVRAYEHQIFYWVQAKAKPSEPPQIPEVLIFYRDSRNACHVQEADPLMILILEHFRKPGARLEVLEPIRRRMLPTNKVPLEAALGTLKKSELVL